VNFWLKLLVTVGVVGVIFGVLWKTGQLLRLTTYIGETREELRKCTWPTWDELKGSTTVVTVSIIALGLFTVVVDLFITMIFGYLNS